VSDIIANSVKKIIIPSEKGKNGIGAGIWNIGAGRDPFGGPTRTEIPILDRLPLLAKAGITYLEVHDAEIPAWTKALKVDRKKNTEFRATQRCTVLAGYLAECLC
jgi:hypothetical protein